MCEEALSLLKAAQAQAFDKTLDSGNGEQLSDPFGVVVKRTAKENND